MAIQLKPMSGDRIRIFFPQVLNMQGPHGILRFRSVQHRDPSNLCETGNARDPAAGGQRIWSGREQSVIVFGSAMGMTLALLFCRICGDCLADRSP